MKKRSLIVLVGLLIVAIAAAGAFAAWSVQTQVTGNMLSSAKFDVGIGTVAGIKTDKTINAVWTADNMAPGDPAVVRSIYMYNNGSIPVNVVSSGFALSGDAVLANNICVTVFTDSNGGGTPSDDLASLTPGWTDPTAGCVTLTKLAQAVNGGWFSQNSNTHGIFIAKGEDAVITLGLALRAGAKNDTIDKNASFVWTLTAQQTPVNPAP